ncbi:VOC family protein [Ornithinibacillus halophilus]|uniref:Catechol 2,3-dioxygenase n=1 Tax=Ornithinibacillus halophilus TaxID=930117 RepID=A0A1M5DX63_9BACI|nr:VOC family protein [Ornithinibacillus halophilus]SHF71577.1 catechol 2,3-dioxygenase [Ornithinibacillus halophilus]
MENKFFEKPTVYVGEVNINVTDLDKSLQFYKEILGFQVLEQNGKKASLTADGKTAILSLEQPEGATPKEERKSGLYHFAILLPSRADLSSFLKHIIKNGVRLGASDHYVSEALYLNDPDGNGIEVYRDRPATEWSWTGDQVAMATEPLDGEGLLAESNEEWKGLPKGTVMGHIHLHVADLDATENFYVNGLGFDIVTRYPGALFASTGRYHHHIGLNVWNGVGAKAPSSNSAGLNWFTLVFPDQETRATTVGKLEKIGAIVEQNGDVFEVKDPSENTIQLIVG